MKKRSRITELRQRNGVSNSHLLTSNNGMRRNLSIRSEATKFHRLRMFEKHGVSMLWDFSETMYHQFGVRVVILAGYCDREGDPVIML